MKAGIKVGPRDWRTTLSQAKAECAEIWFRLDWQKKYFPLFQYLKKNKISFGLHFWAMVKGRYFPNLLCLDKNIAQESCRLIKQTIDIASQWQAKYVVFHPESYRLNLLDLDKKTFKTLNPQGTFNREKSFGQLLFYLKKIKKYGEEKRVLALIETVPKYAPSNFKNLLEGRLKPQLSEGLETEKFLKLARLGFSLCLDIEHTMSQFITNDRDKLFSYLMEVAKKLKPAVKLMHITTKIPPFNGTDAHCGLLTKDFQRKGIVPTKKELIQVLSLFKEKNIWLIPEPYEKMLENHLALKKIVEKVEKQEEN
jgi:hypothetical protein